MPFFTKDQEDTLSLLHHADPRHADLIGFLSGPLASFAAEKSPARREERR